MNNPERVTYFAATDSRGKRTPFGIKQKDRSKHVYIIGKTGMGKSTLLENMAIQDIRNGEGFAFIDPHGGTADKLLDYIPKERINDVVYFAPFDLDTPIAFNVMEDVGYDKRHLVVSGLMATFKKIWLDAWSARMEYILSNTLLALLEYPGATLLGVNRMYTDKAYRKLVVENVKDPIVKDFWTKEFATYTDRYTQEATPAIQNKIGQFTSNPLIRNIISQPKSSFDIRDLMDRRKILIINLSKGLVGETNMRLLGSMLTTRIFLAAMSRASARASELADFPNFFFYVDEFQNFANETFAEILSEARKYKLNLTIAHQYVEQMEEEVAAAVFGNVGTTIAFRVGPFDAEKLEVVFSPEFTPEDLVNLGFAQIYLSLMIDGIGSRPFSAVTIPPIEPPKVPFRDEVIAASRANFGTSRADVEKNLMDDLSRTAGENALPPDPPANRYQGNGFRRDRKPPERSGPPRPRADERPRPPREATPRQERPPAVHPVQSPQDLRAIVRSIAEGAKRDRGDKEEKKEHDLKGALSAALGGTAAEPAAPRAEPSRAPREERPRPEPSASPAGKKPFEVPEDVLRDVFKNEGL